MDKYSYDIVLVTPPDDEPISLEEACHHLKMDEIDEDNELISGLIKSAREQVERATWQALVTQEWKMFLEHFPCAYEYGDHAEIRIPKYPLQSVTHVKYINQDGDQVTLTEGTDYTVYPNANPGFIAPVYNAYWPYARCQPQAVEIQFKCGFGNADAVPGPIKDHIKMLISYLYANRGEVEVEFPQAIDRLKYLSRVMPF